MIQTNFLNYQNYIIRYECLIFSCRLQVKFVLEAVSFDTLSGQDRDIVVEALEAPMGKSSQVSVKGKKSLPVPSGKAAEKSEKCETSGGCFISKLFKYLFYSLLIVSASSQFACTRPYYEVYAQPYYNQYLKVRKAKNANST